MKRHIKSIQKICLVALIVIFISMVSACTKNNKLRVESSLPVTFELDAKKSMLGLSVKEISPIYENGKPIRKNVSQFKVLWAIRWTGVGLSQLDKVTGSLPKVVYGEIPPGFEQITPHQHEGKPIPLEEGKIYEVTGGSTDFHNEPRQVWFKIEKGAVIYIPWPGE